MTFDNAFMWVCMTGIFLVLVFLALELQGRLINANKILNGEIWEVAVSPLVFVYNWTLGLLFATIHKTTVNTGYGRLNKKLSGFGGIPMILLAATLLIFTVLWLAFTPDAWAELGFNLIAGTAVGAPVSLSISGLSFSLSAIIGAGFTRFLSTETIRQMEADEEDAVSKKHSKFIVKPRKITDEKPELHRIVKWLYLAIFFCGFGFLGSAMSNIFDAASSFIMKVLNSITSMELFAQATGIWGLLLLIGSFVALVVIGYLWLILLVMMIKEYLSTLCFCLVPFALLILVSPLLTLLSTYHVSWLAFLLLLAALIFGEWNRYWLEHMPDEKWQKLNARWAPYRPSNFLPKFFPHVKIFGAHKRRRAQRAMRRQRNKHGSGATDSSIDSSSFR